MRLCERQGRLGGRAGAGARVKRLQSDRKREQMKEVCFLSTVVNGNEFAHCCVAPEFLQA